MRYLAVALFFAFPSLAMAQTMTREQMLQLASERGTCGERVPVEAVQDPATNRIRVTCGDATGFIPLVGVLGLGGGAAAAAAAAAAGLALVGAASGGDTAPPSTN